MMKFGHHDSPVLLEALADLLCHDHYDRDHDAKQLAARAYLKASYAVADEQAKRAYRRMAGSVLYLQTRGTATNDELFLQELDVAFQQELDDARQWYETVRQDELTWINEGKDPEQEFDRVYYREPEVLSPVPDETAVPRDSYLRFLGIGCGALAVLVLWRWYKKQRIGVAQGT
jgi:hypothetical protein